MEDISGTTFGRYRLLEPLGEGGMATVYRAFRADMDRYVAIKVLPRHLAREAEFVARFQQEARLVASLQHPHILPVLDYGSAEGYTYLVMPLVAGGTLADKLRGETLSLTEVRRLGVQLADALDYAHEHHIIHRDIKPSNILLDERENVLLTDFGVAKMVADSTELTRTGALLGTPTYMAPEQIMGKPVDGRTDIYALGVLLYQLVTGRPPFRAETPLALMHMHVHDPLPPPRKFNPQLPTDVEGVLLRALARDPEERFPTAGALAEALRQAALTPQRPAAPAQEAVPPTVPAPGMGPTLPPTEVAVPAGVSPPRRAHRRSLLLGLALLLILFIGGGGGYAAWYYGLFGAPPEQSCTFVDDSEFPLWEVPQSRYRVRLDGEESNVREWSDAGCYETHMLRSKVGPTFTPARFFLKHDREWLYMLIRVPGEPEPAARSFYMGYFWPYPYTGLWEHSHLAAVDVDDTTFDGFGWDEQSFYPDEEDGGTIDVEGAGVQQGDYVFFEFRQRISGDPDHDWTPPIDRPFGTGIDGDLLLGIRRGDTEYVSYVQMQLK